MLWASAAPSIRQAFDALVPGDPARGGVTVALGRLGASAEDTSRLLSVLNEEADWKLRVLGARALGAAEGWVSVPAVQEALLASLSDPVAHVGVQAAQSLLPAVSRDDALWTRTRDQLAGAALTDPVRATLFPAYVARGELDPVLAAAQGPSSVSAQARALAALTAVAEEAGVDVFLNGLASPHPMVAAAAADGAVELWDRLSGQDLEAPEVQVMRTRLANAFLGTLADGTAAAASRVAMALVDPAFAAFRADAALEEALAIRHLEGVEDLTRALALAFVQTDRGRRSPLVQALLQDSEYPTRRAVATALALTGRTDLDLSDLGIPSPERTVGWPFLSELGPYPRLEIRTNRGNLVVKLDATQAPLTVQTLAEQANAGLHDGTLFHRVLPNFVIQAGDIGLGDGTGGPNYRIQTELTRIPFERGVIGMASSGPHTEGSQWFITHSRQPHLDGSYTSFGWLLEGWDTLDAILEGDQVLSMRVVRDPNWTIPR
jgi:peptidylprolyl isomerase